MAQVTVTKREQEISQFPYTHVQYTAELSNGHILRCADEAGLNALITEYLAKLNKVEQVYSDGVYTFAFSEVLYIEATNVDLPDRGYVVLRNSRWSTEMDMWDNAPCFSAGLQAVIDQYKAWVEAQAS